MCHAIPSPTQGTTDPGGICVRYKLLLLCSITWGFIKSKADGTQNLAQNKSKSCQKILKIIKNKNILYYFKAMLGKKQDKITVTAIKNSGYGYG